MGNDTVIDDHVSAMARNAGRDELDFAARQIVDIARTSDDLKSVARALKALKSLLPLDPGLENALDKRLLALIDRGPGAKNPELAEAISLFVYWRAREHASVARPYIPVLLSFLEQNMTTTGAYSYYTLMIVANETPICFGPHAGALVRKLDSKSFSAKTFAIRIIAALAVGHPEYVADARYALRNLADNSPHEVIKAEAAKAYQAIKNIARVPESQECRLIDEQANARIYETPVWQRAVEGHLSSAYGDEFLIVERPQILRPTIKRENRRFKRGSWYREFIEELKPAESSTSLEDSIAILSHKVPAGASLCDIMPAELATPSDPIAELKVLSRTTAVLALPPVTPAMEVLQPEMNEASADAVSMPETNPEPAEEASLPVIDESPAEEAPLPDFNGLVIEAPLAEEHLQESPEMAHLREMMDNVQNDFSATAESILEAIGMGHLKPGITLNAGDSNRKISAKEFVSAMEKLIEQQKK